MPLSFPSNPTTDQIYNSSSGQKYKRHAGGYWRRIAETVTGTAGTDGATGSDGAAGATGSTGATGADGVSPTFTLVGSVLTITTP